jgi:Lrp/AsnC family transcriptional regulator, regulator for asnA, asnC and gidA
MQPDQTDWKIISILKEGYVPNNTIARKLGVSEGTVRARLKRLKEAGILQIRALINPDVLENQQLVIVAIRVAESKLLETKS